jgi:hypothetical protein
MQIWSIQILNGSDRGLRWYNAVISERVMLRFFPLICMSPFALPSPQVYESALYGEYNLDGLDASLV